MLILISQKVLKNSKTREGSKLQKLFSKGMCISTARMANEERARERFGRVTVLSVLRVCQIGIVRRAIRKHIYKQEVRGSNRLIDPKISEEALQLNLISSFFCECMHYNGSLCS